MDTDAYKKEAFDYNEAFSRNLGLISEQEQLVLKNKCVAIAGCGGVGSAHAHTLARLGIGRFHLADPDDYSIANFNRQFAANMKTIDRNKAEVTAEMIYSINPEAQVEISKEKVDRDNADDFVSGSDIVIDGVDFFSISGRRNLFRAARNKGTPALTAAPLGFSGTLHVFTIEGMSFDDYFDLDDSQEYAEQIIRFLIGLAPSALHSGYLDLRMVDPVTGRGPSSIIGVQLAASLVGAEVVRILLHRGSSRIAPAYFQFDAYRQSIRKRHLRHGNRNWLQRVKRIIATHMLSKLGLLDALRQVAHE